jgi:hypothetical protein
MSYRGKDTKRKHEGGVLSRQIQMKRLGYWMAHIKGEIMNKNVTPCGGGLEYVNRAQRVVRSDEKGTQCPGV